MTPQTDADRFLLEQLRPVLQPGESVLSCAYLAPVIEGGKVAVFVQAATRMAAFAALTDRRLHLVQTRLGAFKPLLENHGVQSLERAAIRGVFVGATLMFELADGAILEYRNNAAAKDVSSQAEFFAVLPVALGTSATAASAAQKKRRQSLIGLGLGIALALLYVWYRMR
ncbi:MAG: hypothetical protein NVS3B10_07130 [Polyangiales bacterium]